MPKNTKVISLSVKPETEAVLQAAAVIQSDGNKSKFVQGLVNDFLDINADYRYTLKRVSQRRGISVSQLVEYLIDRFPLEDESVKPIVLRVPVGAMKNRETLEKWMNQKTTALLNHLFQNQ